MTKNEIPLGYCLLHHFLN